MNFPEIYSATVMMELIQQIGFLPLLDSGIEGFSAEDGKPYGLPLALASDDDVNWYFHGALEGKKLEAIKAHPEVCLSAVIRCAPTVGPKDGGFTLQFKSAIAFGKAEIVTDEAEKIQL